MKIRDYYDRTAEERTENYQESSSWMNALVHRPNERFVRRRVRRVLQNAESIADLGCGTGEHLRGELPSLERLFLNDLSPKMLDAATARLRDEQPGVEIVTHLGSIESVPKDVAPCEVALCLGVLNHFEAEPLQEALRTLARLARERIVLYYAHEAFLLAANVGVTFRDMGIHYRAVERDRVVRGLADHGFEMTRESFAFRLARLSPLVIQEFRRKSAAGAG